MQYEKYRFYDDGVEMAIPSCLKEPDSRFFVPNSFVSDNKRVIVNISRGTGGLIREHLEARMDEYYKEFAKAVSDFECLKRDKRQFLDDMFVDLRYLSDMMGYPLYNAFILGIYGGRELIVSMQCMQNETVDYEQIFDYIAGSIRILKKDKSA